MLATLPAALQERGWAASGSLGQPPGHGKAGTVQQGRERTEAPQRQSHRSHCSLLLHKRKVGSWADSALGGGCGGKVTAQRCGQQLWGSALTTGHRQ